MLYLFLSKFVAQYICDGVQDAGRTRHAHGRSARTPPLRGDPPPFARGFVIVDVTLYVNWRRRTVNVAFRETK